MRKRKAGMVDPGNIMAVYHAPRTSKRRKSAGSFVPGKDRISGNYGRFAGPGGEMKFFDTVVNQALVGSGGNIFTSLNLIPQGVGESARNGRKCTIRLIEGHCAMTLPEVDAASTPTASDYLRVIVYLDKQCNGTTATTGLLLTAPLLVRNFANLAEGDRFTFLHDKIYTLNYTSLASDGAGVVSQASVVKHFTIRKKCAIPIEFNNTTGVLTEIRSNNIGILLISQNGRPQLHSDWRIRFSDRSSF